MPPSHTPQSSTLRHSPFGKRPAKPPLLPNDDPSTRKIISSLKSQITTLERAKNSHHSHEIELEARVEQQRLEIERLKSERYELYESKMDERAKGEEREKGWYEERQTYSDELVLLRERNMSLKNDLEALRSQQTILSGRHVSLAQSSENEITLLQARVQEIEKERDALKSWERRAKGLSIELEEERRRKAETREKDSELRQDLQVDETLSREVKRQSLNLATVWRENESLKADVVDLRQKVKKAESLERTARENEKLLKEDIRVLEGQLEHSRKDMDSLTQTFPTPSDSEELSILKNRLSTLSNLHTQLSAELAQKDSAIRDLHTRLSDLAESSRVALSEITNRAQDAERELRWAREGRDSAERRESLARRELETYLQHGDSAGTSKDNSCKVAQLEELVGVYKAELEDMARDSRATEEKITHGKGLVQIADLEISQSRISQLEQEVAALEATVQDLTTANTHLDGEVNSLMQRVSSGEYNTAIERCLEHRNNPSSRVLAIRKQELQELKGENEELLERLAELDGLLAQNSGGDQMPTRSQGEDSGGVVPRSSFNRLKKEKEELEKAHAKRLLRLKEIFTAKSKEFLEAVYSLLGWRIKFDESGSDIRLTSMYAPKGKSGLTIKFTSSEGHFGTMQMSGMMARGLEECRQFWVVERQSVPGFLAQVTTEMFEKTTVSSIFGPFSGMTAETWNRLDGLLGMWG
nr:mitotic spindle assembly checkpoint protein MAD1 [Cryptococcus depauperatus CBS 7841]